MILLKKLPKQIIPATKMRITATITQILIRILNMTAQMIPTHRIILYQLQNFRMKNVIRKRLKSTDPVLVFGHNFSKTQGFKPCVFCNRSK